MNTTHEEKQATKTLVDKCRVYLLENFHKFSEDNKIKIALKLLEKSMPTQLEGNLSFTQMKEITKGNRIQEFLIGEPYTPGDVEHPGQAAADNHGV